ncbi:IclR family transcription regulator [Natrialba magadii ATCC 43099]|uniref:IclR family transcription regulator n=1 Tax=Natrialba magadii (strain ATCC 43099 / DSM 3394 / CCM 3739 / CIP 104546 / IAM 13178 / JCM 8861 / NBRC 102185 / NCIMB 2190 / MS3) TaxID=547559 RepID=D3T039_NATMM|nr:IclR family transcriptional regulator [Natrialba magadii]ADD04397.1 IclR family transcription regulator [Natrialba magadii ATCC 43099]ELY25793.1 IclR family transcriptional regulator [Natrialba magadii ATCC 43099]
MPDTPNRSVARAFTIIDELSENGSGRASELAARLEMPVSTVHDYLQALVDTGYVTVEDKVYHPSTRFLEVGHRQRHRFEVVKAVRDELAAVAEETGEHVTLLIEENDQAVILAVQEGSEAITLFAYPGARMPLHVTAPGKAMLAHMDPKRVESILDRGLVEITSETITDPDVLLEQLELVRERGYAVDEGERIAGMVCIAAPVLDKRDELRGAICVCGPESRLDETRRAEIADVVKRAANVTQVNLDYV